MMQYAPFSTGAGKQFTQVMVPKGRLLGFVVLALLLCAGVACDSSRGDAALPSAPSPILTTRSSDVDVTSVGSGITNSSTTQAFTTLAALGSTDVPLVAGSYCGFTSGNPYPCCQNSPGQYGNCTGAAWEVVKTRWSHQLPAWGNANRWADAARSAGYLVDTAPTPMSIGVNSVYPGHVGYVTSISGSYVTNYEQQCGAGYTGGFLTKTRPASYFNAGFIRAGRVNGFETT